MRKTILTSIAILIASISYGQINVYKPYRTNGNVQVADSALFVGKLKIPSASSPSLGGYADKAGQGFQLNTTNNRLTVRSGSGAWLEYPTTTELGTLYIQNQSASQQTGNFRITGTARSGKIGVGDVPLAQVLVQVSAPITGATSSFAYYNNSTISSDVTGSAYGLRTLLGTQATSFTLSEIQHYVASQGTIGAGSTVTSQFGFNAQSSLVGATVNYGFYGNIPAASGRWNVYMNGTANNYFNGNVLMGSATDNGAKLQVTGKATVSTAPTNSTDVVRKTELDLKASIATTTLTVLEYADNAAAIAAGLAVGRVYRTGDLLKIVH